MTEVNQEDIRETDSPQGEGTENSTPDQVDYKEELERAKSQLQKKEKQVKQAEHVIENLKKDKGGVTDIALIEQIIEERMSNFTEQVRGDAINTLVHSYASSDEEAELIKHHLKHSIRASGDDEADILNAKALANKTKLVQQSAERRRAELRSEPDKVTTAGAKDTVERPLNLTRQDQNVARAFGLTREEIERGFQR